MVKDRVEIMDTRDTIRELATKFLIEVSDAVKRGLGEDAYLNSRSLFRESVEMPPGHVSMSVMEAQVREFDTFKVDVWCQQNLLKLPLVKNESPNVESLKEALLEAGIDKTDVQLYLRQLIRRWCTSKEPYGFPEDSKYFIDEFITGVVDGQVETESTDAIASMNLTAGPLELGEGITLRPIGQVELTKFGKELFPSEWQPWEDLPPPRGQDSRLIPDSRWLVFTIKWNHHRDGLTDKSKLGNTVAAFLMALVLCKKGGFAYLPYPPTTHYGKWLGIPKPRTQVLGSPVSEPYILDRETADKLTEMWPRFHEIVEKKNNYLAVAARRLIDGVGRLRPDDAVVDFSIGLEALLSPANQELSYRISLGGAHVMGWDDGGVLQYFNDLKGLYNVRSKIVHGKFVDRSKLGDAYKNGERMLRQIWWWFFNQSDIKTRDQLHKRIQDRVLDVPGMF